MSFEDSMNRMQQTADAALEEKKQARRDLKKLEKIMPDVTDAERQEIFELKKGLEELID